MRPMLNPNSKRLTPVLLAFARLVLGVLEWLSLNAQRTRPQQWAVWQWRLSLRVAAVVLPLVVAAEQWNLWRLWVNGPLSDGLLQEVLQEKAIRSTPHWASNGEAYRCVVPANVSAAGLLPYLNAADQASASAWIEPAVPWLGGDWWVVDVVDRRIETMSRMDKALLQPHTRMKEAQCVPANAMKWIDTCVNGQGRREFQVIDLSRTTVF